MAQRSKPGGWASKATTIGVILAPIGVLAVLFWLLAMAYGSHLQAPADGDEPSRDGAAAHRAGSDVTVADEAGADRTGANRTGTDGTDHGRAWADQPRALP
ncbi:MAG: hypothetical protein KatS3mg103_0052 [Phycisphaerales bacterium]|nr:MAG: hypothetical protein KatS3mg103_0052 [Phycisphaerales bacterium]